MAGGPARLPRAKAHQPDLCSQQPRSPSRRHGDRFGPAGHPPTANPPTATAGGSTGAAGQGGALRPTLVGEGVGALVLRGGAGADSVAAKNATLARNRQSAGLEPEGCPLGDQLLMAHQLVAGVLVGLTAVAVAQVLEPELHGGEHGVVVVHRESADSITLRESVAHGGRLQPSVLVPGPSRAIPGWWHSWPPCHWRR